MPKNNSKLILITGGVKSGKSSHALTLAGQYSGKRVFLATAEASDERMEDRIGRHKKERGQDYFTIEEPLLLSKKIDECKLLKPGVVVVDCLTLWLNNLFHYREQKNLDIQKEAEEFLRAVKQCSCDIIVITNEIGLGVYPGNALAAQFMETLGILNKSVAQQADEVIFMVAGCPQTIKQTGTNVNSYSKREE